MELFKILWDQIILCKHKKEIKKILSSAWHVGNKFSRL